MKHLPWLESETLVLGCGNILFGDDGFGPAVVETLKSCYSVPDSVVVMDVGLSVREILFDIVVSEKVPKRIIIVDAVDQGKIPGKVLELGIEELGKDCIDDFSIHQLPSFNLLKELAEHKGIEISVIGAKPASIPSEVKPGLSPVMKAAVDTAAKLISKKYFRTGI